MRESHDFVNQHSPSWLSRRRYEPASQGPHRHAAECLSPPVPSYSVAVVVDRRMDGRTDLTNNLHQFRYQTIHIWAFIRHKKQWQHNNKYREYINRQQCTNNTGNHSTVISHNLYIFRQIYYKQHSLRHVWVTIYKNYILHTAHQDCYMLQSVRSI